MKRWHKIVGCIIFGFGAVIELLLWAFAITDWEKTPWYSCINSLSCAMWINYFVALGLFVFLWRRGRQEKKLPQYSSTDGLKLDWVNGFEIKSNASDGNIIIKANKEGLLSLANHIENLSQSDVPVGTHVHLDSFNSLEDGSDEIIIEKI